MGRIDFIINEKFSKQRRFYDFLMRDIVCCIYDEQFSGMNEFLLLPFYSGKYAPGTSYYECFKRLNEMLSSAQIAALNECIFEIQKNLPQSLPELKKALLAWMPKLTDCHLDGLNEMPRFWTVEAEETETVKPYLEFDFEESA